MVYKSISSVFLLILLGLYNYASAQSTVELFPQTYTIGINVTLDSPDPEMDCKGLVTYEINANVDRITLPAFELARVRNNNNKLSGAILSLPWDTKAYNITIKLIDPTTPGLNGQILHAGDAQIGQQHSGYGAKDSTYYVSPNGTGTAYTLNSPGDINELLKVLKSNAIVYFTKGTYFVRNKSLIGFNNTAFSGAPGTNKNEVIISGLDTANLNWQLVNGQTDMYYTNSSANNPNLLFFEGTRLYPFRSLDEMTRGKLSIGFNSLAQNVEFDANMDGFFRNPSTNLLCNSNWQYPNLLYVKFRDGANPKDKNMKVTAANHAFYLNNCNAISFGNLTFTGYGVSPVGKAIEVENCTYTSFSQCRFTFNDIGILLSGKTSRTTINECEFDDGMYDWSAWKIKATYDDYNPYSCMFPYYSRLLERGAINIAHGFSGKGLDIGFSSFHDYGQAGHLSPPSVNKNYKGSYEIDFHHNHLYRCAEDGFEVDGDARNIRIFKNEFEQCNAPISLAVAQGGPTYIYNNIFHSLKSDTFAMHPDNGLMITPGHPFKTNYGGNDTMGEVNFLNNTVDAKGNNTALNLFSPGYWSKFRIWNNIFQTDTGLLINYRTPNYIPIDFIRNLFYSTYNQPQYVVDTNYNDAQIFNTSNPLYFESFLLNYQLSKSTLYVNPVFAPGDRFGPYFLDNTSPAINFGIQIPGMSGPYFSITNYIGAMAWYRPESVQEYQNNKLVLYPNPCNSQIQLNVIGQQINGNIEVYGMDGRLHLQQKIEGAQPVISHQLPIGTYVLKLVTNNQLYQSKFVVIR